MKLDYERVRRTALLVAVAIGLIAASTNPAVARFVLKIT